MIPHIIFRDEARSEFDQALDWYERQRPGLGADFLAAVEEALDRIAKAPELRCPLYKDIRRAMVRRFPYGVMYRVEAEQVLVGAVFHSGRDTPLAFPRLTHSWPVKWRES